MLILWAHVDGVTGAQPSATLDKRIAEGARRMLNVALSSSDSNILEAALVSLDWQPDLGRESVRS